MKTYEHEPGNGTRYFLAYGPLNAKPNVNRPFSLGPSGSQSHESEGDHLLVWLKRGDVGGMAFRVKANFCTIDQDYFMEKMGMGMDSTADAAALLGFLEQQGHKIRIHSNHDSRGRWITNSIEFSGEASV
jgi:hypothetical protein